MTIKNKFIPIIVYRPKVLDNISGGILIVAANTLQAIGNIFSIRSKWQIFFAFHSQNQDLLLLLQRYLYPYHHETENIFGYHPVSAGFFVQCQRYNSRR